MSVDVPSFPMARRCPFDPPPELAELREHDDPVRRVRLWDGSTPWLVTRHDDVRAVLADPRISADSTRPGYPAASSALASRLREVPSFIVMDDPDHARHRRAFAAEFTARRVRALRPTIVAIVDETLAAMAAAPRPVDLVEAFALPVPSMVICRMLGVPYADHAVFQSLSRRIAGPVGAADGPVGAADGPVGAADGPVGAADDPVGAADDPVGAAVELRDYLADLIAGRERAPRDDLLGTLAGRVTGGELSRTEAAGAALLLLVAGHETTANMISLGALALLDDPEQAAVVRAGPDAVVSSAVEELLRLLTVAHQGRRRVAVADVALRDVTIRAGEGVIVAIEAANRDPRRFADSDHLDVHRRPNQHLAFGYGVHQCLGHHLARVELQVAYPALLRRFPGLRVTEPLDRLPFRNDKIIYGVSALPVTW